MSLRRLGLATFCAALLIGCSLLGVAYKQADRWLLHEADDYLDLSDDQREPLRAVLRQRLEVHRTRELAGYVDFLDRAHAAAGDGLDAAEVDSLATQLQGLVQTTLAGTLPAIAGVLAALEPGQVAHLQARLEADDQRFRKRSVVATVQRRADRQTKTTVGAIEHWTGDLSTAQRERVAKRVRAWPPVAADWHAYRVARTAGLIELLRGSAEPSTVERYLASRWVAHDGRSAALESGVAGLRRGILDLIVEVDGSLTGVQRTALLRRIRRYRDEFAALVPSPSPSPAMAEVGAVEAVGAID